MTGFAMTMIGGVLSILTEGDDKVATFPALSVTVIEPFTDSPSALRTRGLAGLVDATPERASEAVKGKETFVLFQPAALGGGLAAPKSIVGATLSMLIPLMDAARLTLPALSVQVPEADWLAPSALRITAGWQASMPERLSIPAKVTVTAVLFQPFALGPGVRDTVAVGAALSMLMAVTFLSVRLPATS